jgi:hypothetical protein
VTIPAFIRRWLRPGRQGVAVQPERGRVLLRVTRFPETLTPAEARALALELYGAAGEAEREERWA